ncbi:hypothetical protein O5O45_04795 [Hahella aquimaris]|uniref:hypothetical protein n=1 Tax=Hahella sp. HNIBRBA332 TaxID=3015983 RepID=UPI00273AE19D|nr:hypothetical protein [Hahella sp. HNIBRBA332]WLQ15242.1 hypothetical protein O5O45_04795 [Hahella sp. HNIBRBA332]
MDIPKCREYTQIKVDGITSLLERSLRIDRECFDIKLKLMDAKVRLAKARQYEGDPPKGMLSESDESMEILQQLFGVHLQWLP